MTNSIPTGERARRNKVGDKPGSYPATSKALIEELFANRRVQELAIRPSRRGDRHGNVAASKAQRHSVTLSGLAVKVALTNWNGFATDTVKQQRNGRITSMLTSAPMQRLKERKQGKGKSRFAVNGWTEDKISKLLSPKMSANKLR